MTDVDIHTSSCLLQCPSPLIQNLVSWYNFNFRALWASLAQVSKLSPLVWLMLTRCYSVLGRFFCFTDIASGVMRRNNLTAKIPALWLLLSLRPLFPNVPWALTVGEFCRCSHWDWIPQLLVLVGCGFLEYICICEYIYAYKSNLWLKKASIKLRNREGYVQGSRRMEVEGDGN